MQPDFRLDGWTIRKIKGLWILIGTKPGWTDQKNGWTGENKEDYFDQKIGNAGLPSGRCRQ